VPSFLNQSVARTYFQEPTVHPIYLVTLARRHSGFRLGSLSLDRAKTDNDAVGDFVFAYAGSLVPWSRVLGPWSLVLSPCRGWLWCFARMMNYIWHLCAWPLSSSSGINTCVYHATKVWELICVHAQQRTTQITTHTRVMRAALGYVYFTVKTLKRTPAEAAARGWLLSGGGVDSGVPRRGWKPVVFGPGPSSRTSWPPSAWLRRQVYLHMLTAYSADPGGFPA